MKNLIKTLLVLSASLNLAACTTFFKGKSASATSEVTVASMADQGAVVQQAGRINPVISVYDRQHWLDVRADSKDERMKMYAALAVGEARVAEVEARSFLRKHPKDFAGLQVLAASLGMQKKYSLAGYYAGLLESYYQDSSEALNLLALSMLMNNQNRVQDYRRIVDMLQKSFGASSNQIAAGLNLGHLYLELGNISAAAETFATVRVRCDSCVESLMGAGIAAYRAGNYGVAQSSFKQVLSKSKFHSEALYRLALVERNVQKNNGNAKQYLRTMLANRNDKDRMIYQRANTMLRQLEGESDRTATANQVDDEDKENAATKDQPKVVPVTIESDDE